MDRAERSDCLALLLDVLCYELIGRRVSPEMQTLLEKHFEHCHGCRRQFDSLLELIDPVGMHVN